MRKRREEWGLGTPERARESAVENSTRSQISLGGGAAGLSCLGLQDPLYFQLEDGSEVRRAGGCPVLKEREREETVQRRGAQRRSPRSSPAGSRVRLGQNVGFEASGHSAEVSGG